ncbi:hypothetical protein [Pseudoroseomonas sp. WGS1072]|uniref:hypothetical protein n=1 Tax=Roseomonas sp. WGS1072 TaxID=3366816 RepID=UPI003BF3F347
MLKFAFVAGAMMLATTGAMAQESGLRCPSPGTKLERTNQPTLTYRGTDPLSPLICIDGAKQARFLGYWSTNSGFFSAGGKQLLTAFSAARSGPSQVVEIEYFGRNRNGDSTHVKEQWQILGTERVSVPAGDFNAIKVSRFYNIVATNYKYTEIVWIDQSSGAPVKSQVTHLNGIMSADVVDWQAAEVATRSHNS